LLVRLLLRVLLLLLLLLVRVSVEQYNTLYLCKHYHYR
jgi:hypothetical protein